MIVVVHSVDEGRLMQLSALQILRTRLSTTLLNVKRDRGIELPWCVQPPRAS